GDRFNDSRDHSRQGGLSASVGSGDCDEFIIFQRKADIFQDFLVRGVLGNLKTDIPQFQHCCSPPSYVYFTGQLLPEKVKVHDSRQSVKNYPLLGVAAGDAAASYYISLTPYLSIDNFSVPIPWEDETY